MPRAVISYIPALHQGYIKFLQEHPGKLYVLGRSIVLETPRLERDIRALDPATVVRMVIAAGVVESAEVLNDPKVVSRQVGEIVMPDEDVNRNFAAQYLKDVKVDFVPAFLRWHGHNSQKEFTPAPDRKVSSDERDIKLMSQAANEAAKSPDWWRQIGSVIAREGKVLLSGHNRPLPEDDYWLGAFGDPRSNFDYGVGIELTTALHAEAALIAEAARRGIPLEGAALYASTFPCPVCAKSIAASGIKQVYYDEGYSLLDAEDILKSHGVELIYVDKKKARLN